MSGLKNILTMPHIEIEIDPHSGFCFGVVNAIKKAEEQLDTAKQLYCLGDIVHNTMEVQRLCEKGLNTLTHDELQQLHDARVLFRAHGEPPATYQLAKDNRLEVVDATCPVVLHLQKRIKTIYEANKGNDTQLLIFGKAGHAEVNGLVGQTEGNAIVIEHPEDLDKHTELDFSKPIVLFSQTTKSSDDYRHLIEAIKDRMQEGAGFNYYNTICRHFGNRLPEMQQFAAAHDCIVFVSDAKSSNGKALFQACQDTNPRSYFVSGPEDVRKEWTEGCRTIGICGATSTPNWLMESVKARILSFQASLTCNTVPEDPERL